MLTRSHSAHSLPPADPRSKRELNTLERSRHAHHALEHLLAHLTGQCEDLGEAHAVVKGRGDDALCPQASGAQLVHADAGGLGVVAGPDPVVGGRGHDHPHPAHSAGRGAKELPAHL